MVDAWNTCSNCNHRYGTWISSCPKCGAANPAFKRRGSSRGKKIAIAAGVVVVGFFAVVIAIGSTMTSVSNVTASNNSSDDNSSNNNNDSVFYLNDTVIANNFAIKVTDVEKKDVLLAFLQRETPSGVYVVVHMELENRGQEPMDIGDEDFRLIDADQRTFEATSAASVYSDWLAYERINPGLQITGTIVFDVPKTEEPMNYALAIPDGWGWKYVRLGPI